MKSTRGLSRRTKELQIQSCDLEHSYHKLDRDLARTTWMTIKLNDPERLVASTSFPRPPSVAIFTKGRPIGMSVPRATMASSLKLDTRPKRSTRELPIIHKSKMLPNRYRFWVPRQQSSPRSVWSACCLSVAEWRLGAPWSGPRDLESVGTSGWHPFSLDGGSQSSKVSDKTFAGVSVYPWGSQHPLFRK